MPELLRTICLLAIAMCAGTCLATADGEPPGRPYDPAGAQLAGDADEELILRLVLDDDDGAREARMHRLSEGITPDAWDHATYRPMGILAYIGGPDHEWGEPGQSTEDVVASMFHHMGTTLPIGITGGLLASDRDSARNAGRTARDALIITGLWTQALKFVIDSSRPGDPDDYAGFPSGHTSGSMTFARAISRHDPGWGLAAYLWAGGVGWSRVHRDDHTVKQVVAGALLGWYIADSVTRYDSGAAGSSCHRKITFTAADVRW